ncbi:MAG: hypothetical protein RIC30_21550 [Marinoscillum sp.]|uniref:hypothetical protein n=1 Tax=Marinoscillum sp. TaxID=2024838 RepID=UPI0032FC29A5
MKNKIYLVLISLAFFACGGTGSSQAESAAADSVEVSEPVAVVEEVAEVADSVAMEVSDSVEVVTETVEE